MHAAVLRELAQVQGPRRRLVGAALAAGQQAAHGGARGDRFEPWRALRYRLADRLVFSQIRGGLGGRLRYAVSGGAKLFLRSPNCSRRWASRSWRDMASPSARPWRRSTGRTVTGSVRSVPPVPGVELKVADDGEVLIRGAIVFAGYRNDEASTREVLDREGWLRTGDVGVLDDDGFLTITDRQKKTSS